MNTICGFFISIVIFLLGCKSRKNAEQVYSKNDDFTRNNIKLKDLNGFVVNLEKYEGKTLFINFWATWCKPCIEEMPSIESAIKILRKENIDFLFASEEDAALISTYRMGNTYNFNYVRVDNSVELNIMALPTTFIFNPAGKLVFNESGSRQWDDKNNIDLILSIIQSK